jgi:phenylacetate-CoA ligase
VFVLTSSGPEKAALALIPRAGGRALERLFIGLAVVPFAAATLAYAVLTAARVAGTVREYVAATAGAAGVGCCAVLVALYRLRGRPRADALAYCAIAAGFGLAVALAAGARLGVGGVLAVLWAVTALIVAVLLAGLLRHPGPTGAGRKSTVEAVRAAAVLGVSEIVSAGSVSILYTVLALVGEATETSRFYLLMIIGGGGRLAVGRAVGPLGRRGRRGPDRRRGRRRPPARRGLGNGRVRPRAGDVPVRTGGERSARRGEYGRPWTPVVGRRGPGELRQRDGGRFLAGPGGRRRRRARRPVRRAGGPVGRARVARPAGRLRLTHRRREYDMRARLPRTIPILPVATNVLRARHRDGLDPVATERVQARLLRRLVRHAGKRVPYYRERLDPEVVRSLRTAADLPGLPVLERTAIDPVRMLADGFSAANTRSTSTSGSSGHPITAHYSERDLGYLRATYLWDLLACGLRPSDRIGFFRLGAFRRHALERLGLARHVHIDTSQSVAEQVAAFLVGRPTFLWGFPSAIAAVVAELRHRDIRPRWVHTVMFAGEAVADAARAEVLDYFDARGHEVYASVEAYTIARSCPEGALHLRSADVVVEVEHHDGTVSVADGEGEILVTRLHAEAMPLLRYRLGDRVLITPNDCPCGVRSTPIVRQVLGRVQDRLLTHGGLVRNADFLFGVIDVMPHVRQFQVVQAQPGALAIVVVPTRQAPADLAERLRTALEPMAGSDFDVEVCLVDAIAPEPNGKIRLIKAVTPDLGSE